MVLLRIFIYNNYYLQFINSSKVLQKAVFSCDILNTAILKLVNLILISAYKL